MMAFFQETNTNICGYKINSLHGRWLTLKHELDLSVFYIYNYVKYVKALFRGRNCYINNLPKPFEKYYKNLQVIFSLYITLKFPKGNNLYNTIVWLYINGDTILILFL